MNAAATDEEEVTAVKKSNEENGRQSMDGADSVDAPETQTLTGSDGQSAGMTAPGTSSTASLDDSASSPQDATRPEAEDTVSEELPRKRRGILLGTRPGQATPAAVDDGKSLSWMATQAVKAVNAVKASQLEQAQAWKDGAGMSEDEQPDRAEDAIAAIDAGESIAMARQEPAQPSPGEVPAASEAVPPVESSQVASTTPPVPPPGARAAAPRVPARMALMLGVLVMFSYAGYRHWFSADRGTSDATDTTSGIIESAGPAEEAELMTPPAISVVAAPQPAAGSTKPEAPAVEAGTAPTPGPATDAQPATAMAPEESTEPAAEEAKLMTPPPISVVAAPEPAAEQPTPPAAEADTAPPTGPASDALPATARVPDQPVAPAVAPQEAAAGNTPQPAPSNPAAAASPETWYPAGVPAAPSPSIEADMSATQPAPPSSTPPAEAEAAASQPSPPSSPSPAVEARVPASQPAQPAPAARSRYPASGYGYNRALPSWQPYYQPGYQQAPARR
jgi:hypothetical protein